MFRENLSESIDRSGCSCGRHSLVRTKNSEVSSCRLATFGANHIDFTLLEDYITAFSKVSRRHTSLSIFSLYSIYALIVA
jgi:hypothetical protein